jgi:hypothetical protein
MSTPSSNSSMKYQVATAIVVTVVTGIAAPSWANSRVLSTGERVSNTYQTYLPGQSGCVEDLGYGRIKQGCE